VSAWLRPGKQADPISEDRRTYFLQCRRSGVCFAGEFQGVNAFLAKFVGERLNHTGGGVRGHFDVEENSVSIFAVSKRLVFR
jgi:hypothetical protein